MINVAIIGCGGISPPHIQAYLAFPEKCKVVALVDIYKEKAEQRAAEFKLDVEIFDTYEPLLSRSDLQLVSVCTPPYTHAPISIDFLVAGKNVIVEKPMAASLEDCDRMLAAQKKSGGLLSVIAQNRFRTPVSKLKQVLEAGVAGPILHAQIDSFWWRARAYYDLWWRGTWEKEGGGCTLNHAVHHIDMLAWMMGSPSEVTAVLSNAAHDNAEVEDLSVAVLKYSSGALAQVTSSVVHHGEEQQMIFQCKSARVSNPWRVFAFQGRNNGFPESRNSELEASIDGYYENLPSLQHEGHRAQILDMLNAIEQAREPSVSGHDGRRTLEIITAIYKSGSTKSTVPLPLLPQDAFYTREGLLKSVPYFYKKEKTVENFADGSITM